MSRCCSALPRQPSALVLSGGPGLLGRMYNARNATPKKNGEGLSRGGGRGRGRREREERPTLKWGACELALPRGSLPADASQQLQSQSLDFSFAPGQKPPMTGVTKRDVDARAPFSHACSTLTPAAFLSSVSE